MHRSSLNGSLQAPPSKSCTQRALFCASLADGRSAIHSPLSCDDTLATAEALSKLGVETRWDEGDAIVEGLGELKQPSGEIICRESGTTLRFITAVCATTPYTAHITGKRSLLRRPVGDLVIALEKLGAHCKSNDGYPPVCVKGPLQGGFVEVPGNVSSQYISALLLATPSAKKPVKIVVTGSLESEAYVKMTLEMQRRFAVQIDAANDLTEFSGESQTYQPSDVDIEGDWSSAAFLLVAGAIAGEQVNVTGLAQETLQADQYVLSILKRMNGRVDTDSSSVRTKKSQLSPIEVDVSDSPDLFPAICALCATADGVSVISGIRRLRIKESNRVVAMSGGLRQMGIVTRESENSLVVEGGKPRGAIIDSHGDHRIAMAFAALGLCTGGTRIVNAECVEKSYPSFWQDIQHLGADVTSN